jgi:exodeoxyribonuclease VII large subunit
MASLNPDNVLKRGYARITGPDGRTLTTSALAAKQPSLTLHFQDGTLDVATGAKPPKPKSTPPKQDDLFG